MFNWFRRPADVDYRLVLERHVATYRLLPPRIQGDINRFVNGFLRRKTFYGMYGLDVTELHKVVVAANAALVGLQQPVSYFSSVRWILVYPDLIDLAGETFDVSKVILSWEDVQHESEQIVPGANLVVHEFAHVLDHRLGLSHGSAGLREAFDELNRKLEQDLPSLLPDDAAENPQEFFAAASEAFFSCPRELQHEYPALYRDLLGLYKLDMAAVLDH